VTINQSNTTAPPSERILQNLKQLSTSVSSIKDIFSKIGTQQQTASTLLSEDGPIPSPQETLNTNRPTRQPGAPELPNAYEEPSPNIFFTSNRPNEIAPLPEDPTDPEEANREKARAYGSGKRELVLTLSPSLHQSFYIGARDPPTNQENARAGLPQEAIKGKATAEAEAEADHYKDYQDRLDGALPTATWDDTLAEDIKDKDSQDPQDGAEEHELIPPLLTPPRTLTAGPAGVFHNAAGDAHFIPDPG
jgi:hypothetical protein